MGDFSTINVDEDSDGDRGVNVRIGDDEDCLPPRKRGFEKNIEKLIRHELEGVKMVENAAKFSKARQANITIDMRHFASLIRIEVINYSTSSIRDQFEQYVSKLVSSEPEELYFKHLESKQEGDTHSGLGLLMMMKDYDTRFGFRFTNIEADKHEIAVRAHISLEE